MSHWCSIADFQWLEANLPGLTSLDISAIKDFAWTPEEIWTWKELATTCSKLFGRLDELEVSNWADYTAHSRIEYSYSYNDYRFKQKFRWSRRREGGSVASMVFPHCKKLKTLAIRERYSGFHTWNEWEVHQRVCCLVDGVSQHCPPTMTKLRVHDYAPYRSLFSTDASAWSNIKDIEIGLYSWMEDRRDRDMIVSRFHVRSPRVSYHPYMSLDGSFTDMCYRDLSLTVLPRVTIIEKKKKLLTIRPSMSVDATTWHWATTSCKALEPHSRTSYRAYEPSRTNIRMSTSSLSTLYGILLCTHFT